jgi:hypothetical protein
MNMYAVGTEVGLGTGTLYETSACDLDWNKIDVLILSNQYFIIKIYEIHSTFYIEQTICKLISFILKLCLLELLPFKTGKRVPFHEKVNENNIYISNNLFKILIIKY